MTDLLEHHHDDDGTVLCWLCLETIPAEASEEFEEEEILGGGPVTVTYYRCRGGCVPA